jgi:hypothetical protein
LFIGLPFDFLGALKALIGAGGRLDLLGSMSIVKVAKIKTGKRLHGFAIKSNITSRKLIL